MLRYLEYKTDMVLYQQKYATDQVLYQKIAIERPLANA